MDLTAAKWRTSTRTNGGGACVEVADNLPDGVAVRDTKDRGGPVITFSPSVWKAFVGAVKSGQLA